MENRKLIIAVLAALSIFVTYKANARDNQEEMNDNGCTRTRITGREVCHPRLVDLPGDILHGESRSRRQEERDENRRNRRSRDGNDMNKSDR